LGRPFDGWNRARLGYSELFRFELTRPDRDRYRDKPVEQHITVLGVHAGAKSAPDNSARGLATT
jgi:hypothetical protein